MTDKENLTFNWQKENQALIEQIQLKVNLSDRVVQAMLKTPRHKFVREEDQKQAYEDKVLYLGIPGSTISEPNVVAIMTEFLAPESHEEIFEIGTGSGYQATVLAHLSGYVETYEIHSELVARARNIRDQLGIENLNIHHLDLFEFPQGKEYRYDAGMVTASMPPDPNHPLFNWLKEGGRLIAPIGGYLDGVQDTCQMCKFVKREGEIKIETILDIDFGFVPMRGSTGWEGYNRRIVAQERERFINELSL